jgi:hypothetical protein
VGINGQGASGSTNAQGGSGGTNGGDDLSAQQGGIFGGGGGTFYSASVGAVRIIWPGTSRQFPSTRTANE